MQHENESILVGTVFSDFIFDHEAYGKDFFTFDLKVDRLSGASDYIPVIIDKKLLDENIKPEDRVRIEGCIRSYCFEGFRVLRFFATKMEKTDEKQDENIISFYATIKNNPKYRITPKGRKITDFLSFSDRSYGRKNYIPCIAWGKNAKYISTLPVGTWTYISGRLQSRVYEKRISKTLKEYRTVYEVSVNELEVLENENQN